MDAFISVLPKTVRRKIAEESGTQMAEWEQTAEWRELKPSTSQRKPTKVTPFAPQNLGLGVEGTTDFSG